MHALIILLLVVLIMSRLPGWLYLGLLVCVCNAHAAPAPRTCIHNPYFNVCNGEARRYQMRPLTSATWDGEKLADQARGEVYDTLEQNTAVFRCSSYPGVEFFGEELALGPAPTSSKVFIGDSVWTYKDGRQYIGEGFGRNGTITQVLSAGEPILTMAPVAGETMEIEFRQSTTGCGGAMKPIEARTASGALVPLTIWYKTIEHLDSFTDAAGQVWADVWHTSLVEWTEAPGEERYYSYWFARGPGLVQEEVYTLAPVAKAGNYTYTLVGEAGP